jgi:hypothetical protein
VSGTPEVAGPSTGERAGERAPVTAQAASLPIRRPGDSYTADPGSERPIAQAHRPPDSVRSAFGAFQTGMEAGRREVSEGDQE